MSDEEDDEFMAAMKVLFSEQRFNDILDAWGVDTSRSAEFKTAAFDGFVPTEQDIIVSTYPKSGTTWAMQIAYQIGYLGSGDFEHIDDVVPWPDKLIPMENPEVDDVSHLEDSPTGLHVIKAHLETEFVPINDTGRYITVIRDPKDLLVSVIHFENGFNELLFGDVVPASAYAEMFTTDRFIYQQWPMFIDSWWRLRDRDNVLVLMYEDMRADGAAAVDAIADFLGVKMTEAQRSQVIEKSGFAWMKANDHRFAPPAWDEGSVSLVREGETGSAKEGLTAEQRAEIDRWCASELVRLGSDFPFNERYAG